MSAPYVLYFKTPVNSSIRFSIFQDRKLQFPELSRTKPIFENVLRPKKPRKNPGISRMCRDPALGGWEMSLQTEST